MARSHRIPPMRGKRRAESKPESHQTQQSQQQPDGALLNADTFTNAPKVSRRSLTSQEREEIHKQHVAEREEAEKLAQAATRGPIGRWWTRVQYGPNRVSLTMSIVALGVVYGDIGTSPLYTAQTFLGGQGGLANADRPAVLGMLSLVFWSITLITTVKYVLIAMRVDNKGGWHLCALFADSALRRMVGDSGDDRRRGVSG